jgi:hypothetical protein
MYEPMSYARAPSGHLQYFILHCKALFDDTRRRGHATSEKGAKEPAIDFKEVASWGTRAEQRSSAVAHE